MKKDSIPWTCRDVVTMARRDSTLPHLKLEAIIAEKHRDEEIERILDKRRKL